MNGYVLLLENGKFARMEQISSDEVEVIPVSCHDAFPFPSLEAARGEARGVNEGGIRGFTIYSDYKVEAVLKVHGVE